MRARLRPKLLTQHALRALGVYERVKTSWLYDLYWTLADPDILQTRKREESFYRTLLSDMRKGGTVFDIGANVGYKTDIFLRLGARVIAVDPDSSNQRTLRRRFQTLRLRRRRVEVVSKAVSDATGSATMYVEAPGSAKNTMNTKWVEALREDETRFGHRLGFSETALVGTVTLDDLIADHGVPFYIKIDVEGHESRVLRGLTRAVPLVSFEVNLPQFLGEGLECIHRLTELDLTGQFSYVTASLANPPIREWLTADAVVPLISSAEADSIEVLWRSPAALATYDALLPTEND